MAKSTTTHHLGVLREAGLITTRHEGQRKLATLRRSELDARFPGLLDAVIAGVEVRQVTPGGTDVSRVRSDMGRRRAVG